MHGFDHPIYIVDGSPDHYRETNMALVEEFEHSLQIIYASKPSSCVCIRLFEKLKEIDTPYVITNNDDDFIIPSQIQKGIEFLDTNTDYSLYHGRAITIDTKQCDPKGNIIRLYKYNQSSLGGESSLERVMFHLSHYNSTYHSLQRTENAIKSYEKPVSHKFDNRFFELFQSAFSVSRGKIRKDNGLYMVRQGDQKRDYNYDSIIDQINWVTESDWCSQYLFFTEALSEEIARTGKLDPDYVKKKVDISFWLYLIPQLSCGYRIYMKTEGINSPSNNHKKESLVVSLERNMKDYLKKTYSSFINPIIKSELKKYDVDYPICEHMKKQFLELDTYFKND